MKMTIREVNIKLRQLQNVISFLNETADADRGSENSSTFLDAAALLFEYREKILDAEVDI